MRATQNLAALVLSFTAFAGFSAYAGVTMTQMYEIIGSKTPAMTNTIRLDKDKVRIDMGQNPDTYMIYRSDKKVFWTVNLKDKSYMEMTEKDFADMFLKIEEAKKKMEAQMANMPPEQKKMMQDMMAKMMPGGGKAAKTTYKKVGSGGTVNGYSTDKYEGTRDGAKSSEIWTTSPKSVNVDEKDYEVLKDMAKFFEKFAQNLSGMVGDKTNGLEGVPVKTVGYKDGKPHFTSEMKEVKKESLDASLFEIPSGLTMRKMTAPNAPK